MGEQAAQVEVENIMEKVDIDGNGWIDYSGTTNYERIV